MSNSTDNSTIQKELCRALGAHSLGVREVFCWEEVSSTMDVARDSLSGLPVQDGSRIYGPQESSDLLVFVAQHQTHGRGRQGRRWQSAKASGVYLTMVEPEPSESLAGFSLAIGYGLVSALRDFGFSVHLKWPNDIVFCENKKYRKCGGILIERVGNGPLLIGVGVNLSSNHVAGDVAACGLNEIGEGQISYASCLALVIRSMADTCARYMEEGFSWFRNAIIDEQLLVTGDVSYRDIRHARITGVAPDGGLQIETSDGMHQVVHSGEVQIENVTCN